MEVDELAALRRQLPAKSIKAKLVEIRAAFDLQADCPAPEIERAARTAVALDRLVAARNFGSLAYYYSGAGNAEH